MSLSIVDVAVSFSGNPVLTRASINVSPGEIVLLTGGNGAGKSTLLNVVSGLVKPSRGRVMVGGRDVIGLEPAAIARLGVTRVPQHPRLIQSASVISNVVFGAPAPVSERPLTYLVRPLLCRRVEAALRNRAGEVLDSLSLSHRGSALGSTLSHGETKLVALARAAMTPALVFVFDEILTALGPAERALAVELIRSLASRRAAVICVEHALASWDGVDTRRLLLEHGETFNMGIPTPERIASHDHH